MQLHLVGIGTGNPDHLTFAGADAIRSADAILVPRKGPDKADLADLRLAICARVLPLTGAPRITAFDLPVRTTQGDYRQSVDNWHNDVARAWSEALAGLEPPPERAALLIWGDPSLYDSSLRIAAGLAPRPSVKVVPGITALQALTAAHTIPLNAIGAPVVVTTGRRLREQGWPPAADRVAVMLDGACAFQSLPTPERLRIWWGAYLGMPNELLIAGRLDEVAANIRAARAEARAKYGWMMDTYLLARDSEA